MIRPPYGHCPYNTPKPPMGCCLFRSGFRHLLTYPFVAEPRKGLDDLKYGHENVRPSMKVSPVLCGGESYRRVSPSYSSYYDMYGRLSVHHAEANTIAACASQAFGPEISPNS